MKRFIDLRGQETCSRFAFYCTVRDRFESFAGDQTWDTWDDFEGSARLAHAQQEPTEFSSGCLKRYRRLCPPWAFEERTENTQLLVCPSGMILHVSECPVLVKRAMDAARDHAAMIWAMRIAWKQCVKRIVNPGPYDFKKLTWNTPEISEDDAVCLLRHLEQDIPERKRGVTNEQ
jgi:hypothetical protein